MNSKSIWIFVIWATVVMWCAPVFSQTIKDGTGLNSQILWSTPGPGNYAFVQSAEILSHRDVSFSVVADHYRKPLGLEVEDTVYWSVARVSAIDFSWAIGLFDRFQVGMVLPVVVEQSGVGASPLFDDNTPVGHREIGTAAVSDLRLHAKTILYRQFPDGTDRGAGLAIDLGFSIPIGDEDNFSGEHAVIWAPTLLMDFRRRWLSAGTSVGVRLRSGDKPGLADAEVGNQLAHGLGITIHLFDDLLMISGETNLLAEIDKFERMGMELRGALGSRPGETKAVTLWLSGARGLANRDEPLLCVPQMRFTLGISYTPSKKEVETGVMF
ncbi:MAG: hypothetical protein JXX14_25630 [Deltaproteobacteria bacterium]|nr:hypothetical protein [Deltaproteobacteria bacterium]